MANGKVTTQAGNQTSNAQHSDASKNVTVTVADDEHSVKVVFPEESQAGQFEFEIPTKDGLKTKVM